MSREIGPGWSGLSSGAAGVLILVAALLGLPGRAGAEEPQDLRALARDPSLQTRLEAGERLVWPAPAHRPVLVLSLGPHVLLLERNLRDEQREVAIRREGAFLVVDGPASLRREQDPEGTRRLDVTTLLGLPWGAPPPAPPPPADSSHLQMIEGDASIVRDAAPEGPKDPGAAAPAPVSVNQGQQAPLVERDDARLGELAEGKVEVGGSKLTLLEHTSMRVVSIGQDESVVEVLGVRLKMKRGSVIDAAFGSLVLYLVQGELAVSPGGPTVPTIKIVNIDPGTGIETTTTVQLQAGQELGVGPTGSWTTAASASPVSVEVSMSAPVYNAAGQVIGRQTVTTFQGVAPAGGPSAPVLVSSIAQVMASANPLELSTLMAAVTHGVSVTELGLAKLAAGTTTPALAKVMNSVLAQLGTALQPGATGINGKLVDLDGETPIQNGRVDVVDANGNVIATATSGPDGSFTLPALADGSYVLQTNGVAQPFQVAASQPITQLTIVAPAASFQAGGAATGGGGGVSTALIVVGGGAVVVVAGLATGLAIGLGGQDGDDTVIGGSNEPPTTLSPPNRGVPVPPGPPLSLQGSGAFGTIYLGGAAVRPFSVRNSTGVVQSLSATVSGAAFQLIRPDGTPVSSLTLFTPATGEAVLFVRFSGAMPGQATGSLVITASPGDPAGSSFMETLSGVVDPNQRASPFGP